MLLNEIFNTKPDVTWSETNDEWRGKFELEGHEYELHLDEYNVSLSKNCTLVDFGFTRDGSWELAGEKISAAKVFGAIFNSLIPKIRALNPDILVFGINNTNGDIESRKSLYSKLGNWYSRGSSYSNQFGDEWIKTANGQYSILARITLSDRDKEIVKAFAESIEQKDV